jgi:hypothetical protein
VVKLFLLLFCAILSHGVMADGSTIDKVYHPYVQALEKELEYRAIQQRDDPNSMAITTQHKLGFGAALNERWFTEVYLLGESDANSDLSLSAYELEAKWQISEQGEYAFDWGLLLELEKEHAVDIWEAKAGLLVARDWGRFSGLGNVFLQREWGDAIQDEMEAAASVQLRYRYQSVFEPGIEWYKSQYSQGIGPVFMGNIRTGDLNSVFWHLGFIFGLNDTTANTTVKFHLEYEFY